MAIYIRYKREKNGRCNICKRNSRLTWDHVPPKGSIDITPVEMESLLDRIAADPATHRPTISQNGVKYRSICSDCNNRLGKLYDPVLNQFSKDVGQFLKSQLHFQQVLHLRTRPTALIRAVIGHLLAASSHPDSGIGSKSLLGFLFDENAVVPSGISVFYWVYPYASIAVVRDIAMNAVRGSFGNVGGFDILKFFPIAYIVTDLASYESLPELTMFRTLPATQEADVQLMLQPVRDHRWPDTVDDGNVILGGATMESSIYARPKV
jgi:hypothetical protein